jgi:hypothetical protein
MSGRLFNDMTLVGENTLVVGNKKSARGGSALNIILLVVFNF